MGSNKATNTTCWGNQATAGISGIADHANAAAYFFDLVAL
jgi:hypothetical protein